MFYQKSSEFNYPSEHVLLMNYLSVNSSTENKKGSILTYSLSGLQSFIKKYKNIIIYVILLLCILGLCLHCIVIDPIVLTIKDQIKELNNMVVVDHREFLNIKPNISIPMIDQIRELNNMVVIDPKFRKFNTHNMQSLTEFFNIKPNITIQAIDPIAVAYDMKDQIMELVNYSVPIIQDVNDNLVGFFNYANPIARNFIKKIDFNIIKLNPNIFKEHF
jgi:hypothetical protein